MPLVPLSNFSGLIGPPPPAKDIRLLLDKRARLEHDARRMAAIAARANVGAVGGACVSFRQHRTFRPHWLGQQCAPQAD
jgi:hypothetical protein